MKTNPTDKPIPWGIYIISAVYGLVAIFSAWLFLNGAPSGRAFALILGTFCALISLGIALRVNLVRKVLMILLTIAVVVDVILAAYLVLATLGGAASRELVPVFLRSAVRCAAAIWMWIYLRRPDVREAFLRE